MPKKKILILGKLPPPYMGPAIATEIILNSSLRNSFELLHLDTKVNEDLGNIGKWNAKKITTSFRLYAKMTSMLVKHRPDLVLIPFSQDTIPFIKDSIFILLAKLSGRKVLLHLRGSNYLGWLSRISAVSRWYVRTVIRACNGVIVLGENLRYLFRNDFPAEKIFVVPNGADYQFPPRSDHQLRLLYFANLFKAKGIDDVLTAVKMVCEKGLNNFKVDVVGSWLEADTEARCRKMVAGHNLPVAFHAPSSGEKKFHFFANADIFIFTPRAPEGHPWVIVEAMAAGLPVIATDKGAIVESIVDGVNGYIVTEASPEEIATKLEALLTDSALRKNMGAMGRKRYEEGFTEGNMAARLEDVFNKVMTT